MSTQGSDARSGVGATVSEAQLLERCKESVERCREALRDLRTHVKQATSHREKCSSLLKAATTSVMLLEELLYSQDIDLVKEKQLQVLCTKVQTAIDEGETKVRVYGSMNSFSKMCAKVFSPGTYARFEEITAELTALAQQTQKVLNMPSMPSPPRPLLTPSPPPINTQYSGASTANYTHTASEGGEVLSSQPSQNLVPSTEASTSPALPPPSAAAPSFATLDNSNSNSKRSFIQRDAAVPVEALQRQRLHRGSRGQAVTAMLYIPPAATAPAGNMGRLWYYVSKAFSGGMFVHDLSNQVTMEVQPAKHDTTVTCIHLDSTYGLLWTGHKRGYIRVWDEAQREPLCEPYQAFNSHVRSLTTDENGAVWGGSDRGNVKCLRLEEIERDGAKLGVALQVKGTLKWAGHGMPEMSSSAAAAGDGGWVDNAHNKEPAHYGAVTAVAAALGRVWTAGGSSAFVCLKEWTQRGEYIASHDLRSVGTANAMQITSQIVRVLSHTERAPSMAASIVSVRTVGGGQERGAEIPQFWQLLTAHDCGMIQVWSLIGQVLRPILRIGDRMAPAKGIVVCEQLGAICSVHTDGRLLIRTLPHPKGSAALTVTFTPNSVSAVKLAFAEIEASKTGMALCDGGMVGVITASNNGTITLWPEAVIRSAALEKGMSLQSEHSPAEQWPLLCYNSGVLQQVLQMALSDTSSPGMSADDMTYQSSQGRAGTLATRPSGSTVTPAMPRGKSLFEESGAAFDWKIDFPDLTFIKVIGEGAIGKVWLGRFQETDVAIKQLNSLGELVGPAASTGGEGGISHEVLRTLEREVGILVRIRHPNVILFMGVCIEPPCVVTEFCSRGSLYDVLRDAGGNSALCKQLDWAKRLNMAMDAAKGMYHLHSHKPPIIHRDLKSPNLLVDKHWRVKVTDFNLSRITEQQAPNVQSSLVANNPRWLAPEVIKGEAFTKASDVYAFGLIMWELITWEVPFKSMSQFQIMMALTQNQQRPDIPDQYSQLPGGMFPLYQQYVGLMQRCWAQEPEQRPPFDQVIAELRSMLQQLALRARNGSGGAAAGAALPPAPAMRRLGSTKGQEGGPAAAAAVAAAAVAAAAAMAGPPTQQVRSPFVSAAGTGTAAGAAAGQPHSEVRASPFDVNTSPFGGAAVAALSASHRRSVSAPEGPSPPHSLPSDALPSSQLGSGAGEATATDPSLGRHPSPAVEVSLKSMHAGSGSSSLRGQGMQPSGSTAATTGATVLAAHGAPPSPFGGFAAQPQDSASPVALAAAQQGAAPAAAAATQPPPTLHYSAASGGPPSPFGGTAWRPSSAAGAPRSPFDDAPAAPQQLSASPQLPTGAVLAAHGPPPSPFGDTPTPASAPPPSPFDGPHGGPGAAVEAPPPAGPRTAGGPPQAPSAAPSAAAAAPSSQSELRNLDSVEMNAGLSPKSSKGGSTRSFRNCSEGGSSGAASLGPEGQGDPPTKPGLAAADGTGLSSIDEVVSGAGARQDGRET